MQPSTPLERQISHLRRYEGRSVRVAIVLLCIAPIVLVTLAVLNLHAAATHAELANMSLASAFTLWLNGPLPEATYSGHLVLALERIDTGVFQLADAPIAPIVLVALRRRRKSARELLALLKVYSA
jgi:hypothetical protein